MMILKKYVMFKDIITDTILAQQKYLRENEMSKFNNVLEVFMEVLNV